MSNTITTAKAAELLAIILETAKHNLGHPNCQLAITAMAQAGLGQMPHALTLGANANFEQLRHDITARHLNTDTPFSFIVAPRHDPETADAILGQPTTLRLAFLPTTASRELGWLAPQPPGTPATVQSAKRLKGVWRLRIEWQTDDGLDEAIEDAGFDPNPNFRFWRGSAEKFRGQLEETLNGIEFGHDVLDFGTIDRHNSLGATARQRLTANGTTTGRPNRRHSND